MKNESELEKIVKEKLGKKLFNKGFQVNHFFTKYKIESAKYFLENLEEIEKTDSNGIVGKKHKEARIFVDCCYYELIGAYDGLFGEINSCLELGVSHSTPFRSSILKKLVKSPIAKKINNEWDKWIKDLGNERNDYTHIKMRGRHIHKEIGGSTEVYDIYDRFDEDKETLVKKLRGYYENMDTLIDDVYGLLIKEL